MKNILVSIIIVGSTLFGADKVIVQEVPYGLAISSSPEDMEKLNSIMLDAVKEKKSSLRSGKVIKRGGVTIIFSSSSPNKKELRLLLDLLSDYASKVKMENSTGISRTLKNLTRMSE